MLDHLQCSKSKRSGLFKQNLIQDYETPQGIVREIHNPFNRVPKYKLMSTREPVKVEFI